MNKIGTRVITSEGPGIVIECHEFPYGRVPLLWDLVKLKSGGVRFFDPDTLTVIATNKRVKKNEN